MNDGIVYLVGAGPGDPGLITRRGLECLRRAEVVVYDRLIPPALLCEAPLKAERHCVAKTPGRHRLSQRDIEALLVAKAQAGKVVVRLKGGDPFLFGRGGEEVKALAEAGVPSEVIPGISSALAVPASVGIPVTHRGVSDGFAVWTGHRSGDEKGSVLDAPTQVILMGVESLEETVAQLIASGRTPQTPVAVISWGTTVRQRWVTGPLTSIVRRVEEAGLGAPATVVVGEVVSLAAEVGCKEADVERGVLGSHGGRDGSRDLAGKRVAFVRAFGPNAGSDLQRVELECRGAEVISLPVVALEPNLNARFARAARELGSYKAVLFTAPLAVSTLMEARLAAGRDARTLTSTRIFGVGEACAGELRRYGIVADGIVEGGARERVRTNVISFNGSASDALVVGTDLEDAKAWGDLFENGCDVEHLAAMRRLSQPAMIALLRDLVIEGMVDVVLFDSQEALRMVEKDRASPSYFGGERANVEFRLVQRPGVITRVELNQGLEVSAQFG